MTFAPATGVQDIHGPGRPDCLADQKLIIDNTFLYRTRLSILFTKTTSYKEIKKDQAHESIDLIVHGTYLASQTCRFRGLRPLTGGAGSSRSAQIF